MWNPAAERMLGWTAEEVVGHPYPAVPDDLRYEYEAALREVYEGRPVPYFETRRCRKDGSTVDVRLEMNALRDSAGNVSGLIALLLDVTETKRAEEALRSSEARFRMLVDAMEDVVFTLDTEQRHTGVYGRWLQISGLSPGFFLGRSARDIFGPEAAAVHEEANRRALAGTPTVYSWSATGSDGKTRHYQTSLSPLRDADGKVTGLVGVGREVTELVEIGQALRESKERFTQFMDHLLAAVFIKDAEGRILFVNRFIKDHFGAGDWVGRTTFDFFPPEVAEVMVSADRRALAEGPITLREEVTDLDGVTRLYETRKFPIPREGKPPLLGGISLDITDQVRAEEALQRSEARYRTLFDSTPVSLWEEDFSEVKSYLDALRAEGVSDLDDYFDHHPETLARCLNLVRVIGVNRAALELCRAESMEDLTTAVTALEPLMSFQKTLAAFAQGQTSLRDEGELRTLAGEVRYTARYTAILPGHEDTWSRIIISVIDITERKQAEEALHRERDLVQRLVETSPTAIMVVDRERQVTFANARAEQVLRLKRVGDAPHPYTPPTWTVTDYEGHPLPDDELIFPRVMSTGQTLYDVRHALEWADGRRLYLSINAAPLRSEGDELAGMVFSLEDVTSQVMSERALRRANRAYQVLSDCNQALIRATDEIDLLNKVCQIVVETGGYRMAWAGYVQHEEGQRVVRQVASAGYDEGYLDLLHVEVDDPLWGSGPTGVAVKTGKFAIVQHISTDSTFCHPMRPEALKRGYQSMISLPLCAGGQVFGALTLYSHDPNAFDQDEAALLEELAGDLAFGITALRTEAQRRQAEQALQRINARLMTLRDIDRAILVAESPETIAAAALRRVQLLLPCVRASVSLFDFETETAELLAVHVNGETKLSTGQKLPFSEYWVTPALLEGQINVIEDLRSISDLSPVRQTLREEGICSIVNVPLLFQEKLIGAFNVCSDQPAAYAPEHLEIVRDVADQLAVALHHAQLYAQVQSYADELERRVAQRTAELKAANDRLRALDRVKDEFVANVSHELRTPISNIKLYLHLLKARPAKAESYLATLHRETERLEYLIEDLLYLSRLDQGRLEFALTAVDLNMLLGPYVTDRVLLAQERGLTIEFEPTENLPSVQVDGRLIGQVLSILLTNAVNYTPEGGVITVATQERREGDQRWVGFSVADTGPGIPPEEMPRLTERFFRGVAGRDSGEPGTGLGLAIARTIIERHGGLLDVHSTGVPGQGARFAVWLPVSEGRPDRSENRSEPHR